MEQVVIREISNLGQDPGRLKKILTEAFKQRRTRLAELEAERRGLERELARGKILMESLLQETGPGDRGQQSASGLETLQENIRHVERHLAETQKQALVLQQHPLDLEQAARALSAMEQKFGSLPVIDQNRLMRLAVQRVEYDGVQGKLAITLDAAGIVALVEEQTKQDQEATK
jgi:hypothetical protein